MAANDPVTAAIDGAFNEHMKTLFGAFARHLGTGAVDDARREFRKGLSQSLQARSEMRAIAEERTDGVPRD